MFKSTANGVVQDGEILSLSEDDMMEILSIIEESSVHPQVDKRNGIWKNRGNLHGVFGYNVFAPGKEAM